MQTFIDITTQMHWAFDEDVVVSKTDGMYSFVDVRGGSISTPTTLQPYAPSAAEIAAQAAEQAIATLAHQASLALLVGLTISSVGTPALNGTYACDQISQMDIIAIETSLNAGKGFPGGATTFNYPDATGVLHTFSGVNFTDFAAAVRDYVYGCRAVIARQTAILPPTIATIA